MFIISESWPADSNNRFAPKILQCHRVDECCNGTYRRFFKNEDAYTTDLAPACDGKELEGH